MKNLVIRPHKLLILLGIVYLFILVGIYFSQEKVIFLPSSEIFLEIDAEKLGAEEFNLEINPETTIHGYFVNTENADKTIMFFHGNGGNLTNNFGRVAIAKKMGHNIAVFDYRGYGQSTGEIKKESDIYEDGEAVLEYLTETHKIQRNSIILWGQSLGGAVAMEMAHKNLANKLILESTFTSLDSVTPNIFQYGIPSFLKKYKFNNLEKIAGIEIPTLIIHSPEDEMINYQNGLDLFDKIKSRENNQFLEIKGDHNNGFLANFEENEEIIKEFLDK